MSPYAKMPSVNLTQLEYNVDQARQRIERLESYLKSARAQHEIVAKDLADAKATIARRAARGEEPDTESEEEEDDGMAASEPPPTVPLPSDKYLSKKEIARLTKIYKNPKKVLAAWKRVLIDGLRENIRYILDSCRDSFTDEGQFEELSRKQVRAVIKDWPAFCDRVYAHMKKDGSLLTGDEEIFQDFEDTASGCDEVVWNAACAVIKMTPELSAPVAPVSSHLPDCQADVWRQNAAMQ